jgi:hypothetical protein
MEQLTNEEMLLITEKLLIKTTEIAALLKDGKVIVAYEKLGGVIKNITACGATLRMCVANPQPYKTDDK